MNAINAIISPVKSLITWVKNAISWVNDLFASGISSIGNFFGFSAAPETGVEGAPVMAALGAAPKLPTLSVGAPRAASTVNIEINMPNYVGSREELLKWLREALAKADRKDRGLIVV